MPPVKGDTVAFKLNSFPFVSAEADALIAVAVFDIDAISR
jgi:hypothetical protein